MNGGVAMYKTLIVLLVIISLILISLINVFLKCNYKLHDKSFFIINSDTRFIEYSVKKYISRFPSAQIIIALDNCSNEQIEICRVLSRKYNNITLIDIKEIDNYY